MFQSGGFLESDNDLDGHVQTTSLEYSKEIVPCYMLLKYLILHITLDIKLHMYLLI